MPRISIIWTVRLAGILANSVALASQPDQIVVSRAVFAQVEVGSTMVIESVVSAAIAGPTAGPISGAGSASSVTTATSNRADRCSTARQGDAISERLRNS